MAETYVVLRWPPDLDGSTETWVYREEAQSYADDLTGDEDSPGEYRVYRLVEVDRV